MALRSISPPRPTAVAFALLLLLLPSLAAQYPPVAPELGVDARLDSDLPGLNSSVEPQLVGDKHGNVHVIWQDFRNATWQIMYRRIEALDPSTSPLEQRLSAWSMPPVPLMNHTRPQIASDGDQALYVVWHGTSADGEHVLFTNSLDGGLSWSPLNTTSAHQLNAAITTEYAGPPRIAADSNGGVYVTWAQSDLLFDQIYMVASQDSGSTWTGLDLATPLNIETLGHRESPRVATDDAGRVFVAWLDHRVPEQRDVYLRRSLDGGLSFRPGERRMSAPGTSDALQLVAHASGLSTQQGFVLAAWVDIQEDPAGNPVTALHSNWSYDGGRTFRMRPAYVTHDCPEIDAYQSLGSGPVIDTGSQDPGVTCAPLYLGLDLAQRDDGVVFAAYGRVDPPLLFEPTRVHVSRFDPGIGIWGGEHEVSRKGSLFPLKGLIPSLPLPAIDASDEAVFVTWMHTGQSFTDAADVNLAWSLDGGTTWSGPSGVTTKPEGPGISRSGHSRVIALHGQGVVVWDDRRAWSSHATLPLPATAPIGAPDVYFNVADPQQP